MLRKNSKVTVPDIKAKKGKDKIAALTAYDYTSAKILSECGIDIILVGDSVGMVIQGYDTTLNVTIDQIIYHTSMVARANPSSLIVADMPFGSFHSSIHKAVENAIRLIKEGGAEAVKLEGGTERRIEFIKEIINAEIPVLGHLGLTPQSINKLGTFRVQGKLREASDKMVEQAHKLEEAGVFGIVLESIPVELGKIITSSVSIPTIGIGAGKFCDGQILVFNDMIGLTGLYMPKFVRKYADLNKIINESVINYLNDVKNGRFPDEKESYHLTEPHENNR